MGSMAYMVFRIVGNAGFTSSTVWTRKGRRGLCSASCGFSDSQSIGTASGPSETVRARCVLGLASVISLENELANIAFSTDASYPPMHRGFKGFVEILATESLPMHLV